MSWSRDALRAQLVGLFEGHVTGDIEVTDRQELVADLGIDSLGVMELVDQIETKFELTIEDDELLEIVTVGDVLQAIESRLRSAGQLESVQQELVDK